MRLLRVASVFVTAIAAAGGATALWAQQPADNLNDQQKLGRSLFVQSCGVCHLKPQLTAPQYAPVLSMQSASGNEAGMRQIISNGSPRMPGFKYQYSETQIAAIASYLKTVPVPAPEAPKPAAKHESRDAD